MSYRVANIQTSADSKQSLNVIMANNVRRIRKEQCLTVTSLALISGISRGLLTSIEKCTTDVRLSNVKVLADALSVSPEELLADPDQQRETAHTQ